MTSQQTAPTDASKSEHIKALVRVPEAEWRAQQAAFEGRMTKAIAEVRALHRREGKDPVNDFLFEYYSFAPSLLGKWSPGFGYFLEGLGAVRAFCNKKGWETRGEGGGRAGGEVGGEVGAWVDVTKIPTKRLDALRWITGLLEATQGRPPFLGCGGMHEWAMVYRGEEVRHSEVPLRLSAAEVEAFVESRPIVCSHHDAFRFFTAAARPLNRVQPAYNKMHEMEQPGCLHTNMDLYRWAYKFYPWISSALIAEAFALAVEVRRLDMEASPYDLRAYGLEPVAVETAEGRAMYQQRQRALYEAGMPLRAALIAAYRRLKEQAAMWGVGG